MDCPACQDWELKQFKLLQQANVPLKVFCARVCTSPMPLAYNASSIHMICTMGRKSKRCFLQCCRLAF